jgi:hypothetical protein
MLGHYPLTTKNPKAVNAGKLDGFFTALIYGYEIAPYKWHWRHIYGSKSSFVPRYPSRGGSLAYTPSCHITAPAFTRTGMARPRAVGH